MRMTPLSACSIVYDCVRITESKMSKQQPFFFYPISVSFTASSKIVVLTVDGVIVSKIGNKKL